MEHKTRSQILEVAKILPSFLQPRPLSKQARLTLWAEALEREGSRRLRTLHEIEYAPRGLREKLRAPDSPLSVAFADQRLRAEGLFGDTVGDATAFFGISDMELHDILCFCYFGETMSAEGAAARVRIAARQAAGGTTTSRGFGDSLRAALTAIVRLSY
jgi:hypothetical protein